MSCKNFYQKEFLDEREKGIKKEIKACCNCKANVGGVCLIWGCPTLTIEETADDFECREFKRRDNNQKEVGDELR